MECRGVYPRVARCVCVCVMKRGLVRGGDEGLGGKVRGLRIGVAQGEKKNVPPNRASDTGGERCTRTYKIEGEEEEGKCSTWKSE